MQSAKIKCWYDHYFTHAFYFMPVPLVVQSHKTCNSIVSVFICRQPNNDMGQETNGNKENINPFL